MPANHGEMKVSLEWEGTILVLQDNIIVVRACSHPQRVCTPHVNSAILRNFRSTPRRTVRNLSLLSALVYLEREWGGTTSSIHPLSLPRLGP